MKYPSYLNLSKSELNKRIQKLFKILERCQICPRKCNVNRMESKTGFCKLGQLPMVSSFHPHFGEESILVGKQGSGTIFFTYCNLACVYCQNYEISQWGEGQEISYKRLAQMMIKLQDLGCHNINLVTPTPQVPQIVKALVFAIQKGLKLPLVYNTNGYDSLETLKLLKGIVDIYMPDARYSNSLMATKYSAVPNYPQIIRKSLKEMHSQVGDLVINEQGIAQRGLLVRHLVLPYNIAGSRKIFEFLAEISANTFLNIMDQYYPCYKADQYPELSRPITKKEYQRVINLAKTASLKRLYKE